MLCPKCRQPLEDGAESYICCANASLQWRCVKCAKVSEGFALPYGLCPHCGGKLERITPRQIDDGATLDGIRKAFEIELGGQLFYLRAAADSTDPLLKDLFDRFASGMEQRAASYFEQCAKSAQPASPEEQLYRELAAEEHEHAVLLTTEYS